MNGGQVWIGSDARELDAGESPVLGEAFRPRPADPPFAEADLPSPSRVRGVLGAVALALGTAWVIGMIAWAVRAGYPHGPLAAAQFAAAVCAVPILLAVAWLLVAVGGARYATQVLGATHAMRTETHALALQIAALGDLIESRRAALAEQARSLAAIGDAATARLGAIGSTLSGEVAAVDRNARALGDTVGGAEARLAALLTTLPRVGEEVAALGARLEAVSLAAGEQAAGLDARLSALTERGREAEVTAGGAAQTLAAHMVRMDATGEAAGARLTAVTTQTAGEVDALLARTAQAVEESRRGIAAQGNAMLAMLGAHQAALDTAARDSAEALAERIEIVGTVIDRLAARLADQRASGETMARDMEGWITTAEDRLGTLQRDGTARAQSLAQSIGALGGSADAMTNALREGDGAALKAIATAETLLIALDAAAREMDETLPAALARLDRRLGTTHALVASSKPELMALVGAAESTHVAVDAVATTLAEQRRSAEAVSAVLTDRVARGRVEVANLDQTVAVTIERIDGFVESAAPRLIEALLRVRDTATAAADKARDTLAEVIPEAAHALEVASEGAFRRAAGAGVQDQVAAVAEVAEAAVAAATRAADRLGRQLAEVEEATARLEARAVEDRAERDSDERESFARRASLLIDALNSAAIDLNRSLAPEVADTAWSAYLKGDRGVFTRRAVRLLDAGEQRAVAGLYDADPAFRDGVNRYIHDFEAMLRGVLSQRDGNPLGVTLVSSEIGKLYVALAQAIERLR